MIPDRIYVPGLPEADQATLDRLWTRLNSYTTRNKLRSDYYDCAQSTRRTSGIIPPMYYRLGIVLGWVGKAVDVPARRVDMDDFTWADGDLNSLGFREFTEANLFYAELQSGIRASLLHGCAFLINTPGDQRIGEPAAMLSIKDAMNATGDWNPRRRGLDNLLSVGLRDDDGPLDLTLYLDGETVSMARDARGWAVVDRSRHPYGVPCEVLTYLPRLDRPFGSSRITRPMMGLQDMAVRTLTRLEAHDDIYAIPDLWLLGATEALFKNADGSQKNAWQVVMGRIKGIPDDPDAEGSLARADIKQFPASSPEPHLASLNAFAKLFAREATLPDSSIVVADMANPTSAEAYDAGQYELIAEIEGAERDWTPPLRRAVMRALAMQNGLGTIPASWATMHPKWRNPRYISKAAEADAGSKLIAALPWLAETEVGLELVGLTPEQITRAQAERKAAAGRQALQAAIAAASRPPAQLNAAQPQNQPPKPAPVTNGQPTG